MLCYRAARVLDGPAYRRLPSFCGNELPFPGLAHPVIIEKINPPYVFQKRGICVPGHSQTAIGFRWQR